MTKASQNCHIQIPTSILKKFSFPTTNNEGQKIHAVYSLKMNGDIVVENIKDVNIQYAYYHEEIENLLCKIETDFGELKKKIIKDSGVCILNKREVETIDLFFKNAMARSPLFCEESRTKLSLIDGDVQDLLVANVNLKEFDLDKTRYCIVKNKTTRNFILPQMCCFCIQEGDKILMFMPITEKIGVGLYKTEDEKEFASFFELQKQEEIIKINRLAVAHEAIMNKQSIFAKDHKELSAYVPLLKDIIDNNIQV